MKSIPIPRFLGMPCQAMFCDSPSREPKASAKQWMGRGALGFFPNRKFKADTMKTPQAM